MRVVSVDVTTGEMTERDEHIDGVMTEAEALAATVEVERVAHNAAIRAQLDANDIKIIRALLEDLPALLADGGSVQRIADHKAAQAALREQLRD